MNKYLIVVVVAVLALSGCDSQEQVKQILKPTYSTIYDYCESLSSYDPDGINSLKESNARMFLERDNVSNPEDYIIVFLSGVEAGTTAKRKKEIDRVMSAYLGVSTYSNTAFVPACVLYIQSSPFLN